MKKYNYIKRIVNKAVSLPTDNETFSLYSHLVDIQSCLAGSFVATIYAGVDRYSGEVATFSFDYWTKHLHIEVAENSKVEDVIINAFKLLYHHLKITNDIVEES